MTEHPSKQPLLLVEDDEADVHLLKVGLEKVGLDLPLLRKRDGAEAIEYLSGLVSLTGTLPVLMVTDLKMPRVDGFELLSWIQQRESSFRFPKVVISSSGVEADRERARKLGAIDYKVKPSDLDGWYEIARGLQQAIEAMGGSANGNGQMGSPT